MLNRLIKYGLYLALVMPLVFTSRTLYPWHFGKTILFQGLIEFLVLLSLTEILSRESKDSIKFKFNQLDWCVLAFLASRIVSSILGVNFAQSLWGTEARMQGLFTWLHFGAFYYLLRYYLNNFKDWSRLIIFTIGIAAISGSIALFGYKFSFLDGVVVAQGRISGLLGNPIFFAGYLVIPLFITLAYFAKNLFDKNKDKTKAILSNQYFIGGSLIVILVALVKAQTRGANVGVVVGLIISILIYLKYSTVQKSKKIIKIASLVFVVLIVGVYMLDSQSNYFKNNYPDIYHAFNIDPTNNTTAQTRLLAWQIGLKGFKAHPVFGWGPENFQDVFDNYYNPQFLDYGFNETVWDKPHNNLVEVLAESGMVGFVAYLAIFFTAIRFLISLIKKEEYESQKIFLIALAGGLIAFEGQNFFSFFTSDSLLMLMSSLAFIAFLYESHSQNMGGSSIHKGTVPKQNYIYNLLGVTIFVLMILMTIGLYKNYTIFKASIAMGDARDWAEIGSVYKWENQVEVALSLKTPYAREHTILTISDLNLLAKTGAMTNNVLNKVSPQIINILEPAIKENPQSYLYRFWLSALYEMMGEYVNQNYYQESTKLLLEAGKISQGRQQVPLHLSKNYLQMGDNKKAIEILRALVKADGKHAESHWFLGLALVQNKEMEAGISELESGITFALSNSKNVLYLIDLYANQKQFKKIAPLYEYLIKQEPDNPKYYANLAATYAVLGEKDKMKESIDKAVELDPTLKEEADKFLKQNK
ncbi:MAG: O-antigen ligase family protein [Candidatus Falkowbacteria bacterium]|nr:O-antigen ligase family protein [Candidatus Falkowbacteria bacterium]